MFAVSLRYPCVTATCIMTKSRIISVVVIVICFAVAGLAFTRFLGTGAPDDSAYFYDLSEATLYVASGTGRAPIKGIGGEPDDGVSAMVFSCCENCASGEKQIAYLQKYTPELKALWEAWDLASEEERHQASKLDDRNFVTSNTLVRRIDGDQWYPRNSPEGQAILGVLTRACSNGTYPRIMNPTDE